MENILEDNIKDNNEIINDNFFKLEYKGQSVESSSKFQTWKKKMLKKYGNNSKIYKCKADNTYFYASIEKTSFSLCPKECPLCKCSICYFCSRSTNHDLNCCVIGRVYYLLFNNGFTYIDDKYYHSSYSEVTFCYIFIRFLFPVYTFFYISGIISQNIYYVLYRKNSNYINYYSL